jgi:pimeloyl-ACP methyl ester carboxylesterase
MPSLRSPTQLVAYTRLDMPILIMRGENAPRPTFTIAERLASMLPDAHLAVVDGAGHMGPITHASAVAQLIAAHIRAVQRPVR